MTNLASKNNPPASAPLARAVNAPTERRAFLGLCGALVASACTGAGDSTVGGAAPGGGGAGLGGESLGGGDLAGGGPANGDAGGAGGAGGDAGGVGGGGMGAGGATPTCEETEDDIEGPFYTPGAPELPIDAEGVSDLAQDQLGEPFILVGTVRGADCSPLAGAELDVWQADAKGVYDNAGFTLRGVVRTDEEGRFAIRTLHPGRYLNGATYRPSHIHVKVRAAGHPELTTQLYFPGDPFNAEDPWFDERLLVEPIAGSKDLGFHFVVSA